MELQADLEKLKREAKLEKKEAESARAEAKAGIESARAEAKTERERFLKELDDLKVKFKKVLEAKDSEIAGLKVDLSAFTSSTLEVEKLLGQVQIHSTHSIYSIQLLIQFIQLAYCCAS